MRAAANPAIALPLQLDALAGRVVELGSLGVTTHSLIMKTMTFLSDSSTITVTTDDPNGEVATHLIHDLCSELSVRYGTPSSPFSPDEALAPQAGFVVARLGGQPIGCGALRRIDEATAEVKRMYVVPHGRRRGIGRRILHALEQLAVGFNYRAIRLETGLEQPEAIGLYESSGYHRIAAYGYHIGDPRSVCFEKTIHDKPRNTWPCDAANAYPLELNFD
jgi:GNAT superfamily N-acetyltransferase